MNTGLLKKWWERNILYVASATIIISLFSLGINAYNIGQLSDLKTELFLSKCGQSNALLQNKLFMDYIYPFENNDTVVVSYYEGDYNIIHAVPPHPNSDFYNFQFTLRENGLIESVRGCTTVCGDKVWVTLEWGEYWFP